MTVLPTIAECRQFVRAQRDMGRSIGFVPTMGALHEGHLSLMRAARQENDTVLISIFVNPTQFGPGEDYDAYPRDLDRDARQTEAVGVHAIFAPSAEEMYPDDAVTYVDQEGEMIGDLEGAHRPGHFRGVLTVCCKLFNIVQADRAYFGRKDYQQFLVLRQMARDLHMPIEIVPCPIVREPDGLAMSSRNQYLDPAAREQATCIYRGLQAAQGQLAKGETRADALAETLRATIQDAGPCEIDYATVRDPETLAPRQQVRRPALALAAVHIGGARLIDNSLLTPED
jgi:pantoate--beta-alanine ligase